MSSESRHQQRVERVQSLFAWDFQPENAAEEQFDNVREIVDKVTEIDAVIFKYAPRRTAEQFDKVDLAILRQALYELMYTNTPPAVVINEAIEIAKSLADDSSAGFIHGVLASYIDEKKEGSAHES